jgi:hypothetical protein
VTPQRRNPSPRVHEPKERLLAIRIPESLFGRLDAFCETMRVEVPWVRMTRSDAVRWLLTVQLEHEQQPGSD